MKKEDFLKLDIKEQVQFINDKTITGLKVTEVANELSMGDNALRRILKKNNYIFNRIDKVYLLEGITIAIPKEEPKMKIEVIDVEEKRNNNGIIRKEKKALFSNKEIEEIKELLVVKEQLLLIAITPGNNSGISAIEIDRSNRKKATFNMDMDIIKKLTEYEKQLINISKSDIVNISIKEYLERNNKTVTKE